VRYGHNHLSYQHLSHFDYLIAEVSSAFLETQ